MSEGILRIATAGSVDNGKSTLIGRLLYDSKSIFEDQLSAVERTSVRKGKYSLDLSLFTDGLRDEVEEGITIDVAYRYFSTPKRKFILADTPGHFEFTRNMITGASTADAIIILIDVTLGITEQTKRHSFIAGLLGIPHVIVCVNKMDLVDWSESTYSAIVNEFQSLLASFNLGNTHFVPISALQGDSVVEESKQMSWYQGGSLLGMLESLPTREINPSESLRCTVQCRFGESDSLFYYGVKMLQGTLKRDALGQVFPSMELISISKLLVGDQSQEQIERGVSATIGLQTDSLQRGDLLISNDSKPSYSNEFSPTICWLDNEPFTPESELFLQHISGNYIVEKLEIDSVIEMESMHEIVDVAILNSNDIAKIRLTLERKMPFDSFNFNKEMGSFILVDRSTNNTVAAGMID